MVFHVAAEPIGLVQKCARCGAVITDYTGAMMIAGDTQPRFWPEHRIIAHEGGMWLVTGPGECDDATVRASLCTLAAES